MSRDIHMQLLGFITVSWFLVLQLMLWT